MNKNIKCKLGIHSYNIIGRQMAKGVCGGFSMTQLQRIVKKCAHCGHMKYEGFDIATNAHLDDTLNWQPTIT